MKKIIIIPSRFGSSRFPGKPLALIAGKPMIQRVYENVKNAKGIDAIYVATDDQRIFDCVTSFGGNAIMTSVNHICGTDRLAECIDILKLNDDDVVLNIQGDEPMICSQMIETLSDIFNDDSVNMGTLVKKITIEEELDDPSVVKVVTDKNGDALYFSRYCIPYERDGRKTPHYKHIGVYGYKASFLKNVSKMEKTESELSESLEQLRVLENGFKIKVRETEFDSIGVDTPQHITMIENILRDSLNE